MGNGAHLLICEQILDPDPASGDPFLYLVDTQMMAMFGAARERSEGESSPCWSRSASFTET